MEVRELKSGYSLPGIFKELRDQTTTLLRQEVALATAEMSEKATFTGRKMLLAGAGAALMLSGLVILLISAVEGTRLGLAWLGHQQYASWLAPLVVGGLTTLIGLAIVQRGLRSIKRTSLVPERTVETLKEDQQWIAAKI